MIGQVNGPQKMQWAETTLAQVVNAQKAQEANIPSSIIYYKNINKKRPNQNVARTMRRHESLTTDFHREGQSRHINLSHFGKDSLGAHSTRWGSVGPVATSKRNHPYRFRRTLARTRRIFSCITTTDDKLTNLNLIIFFK